MSAPAFIDWAEFWARDRSEADWALEDILAMGRGHAMYAVHKTGKSLLSLWCAVEMVKAGHVVIYLDYEMTEEDVHERLSDMGYGPDTDLSRLRYALLPSLPPLDRAEGGAAVAQIVDSVMEAHPGRHLAVVIDTIGRAIAGEEDSNDTFRDFYRHTGLGLKQRGATWLRLDHAGKDASRGQRGASGKGDDVDVVWKLSATEGGYELKRELTRTSWIPERVVLKKVTEPFLHFERAAGAWPLGTIETATALTALGVDPQAPTRAASDALRDSGQGRRRTVVVAAQKYRRGPGTTPGTTPSGTGGNHAGNHAAESRSHGAEPPPEPPGTTLPAPLGTTRGPYRGPGGPGASDEPVVVVVPAGVQLDDVDDAPDGWEYDPEIDGGTRAAHPGSGPRNSADDAQETGA